MGYDVVLDTGIDMVEESRKTGIREDRALSSSDLLRNSWGKSDGVYDGT